MKKSIIIVAILLCTSFINGQSTYEFLYQSPMDEISRSLIEDEDGNLFFTVENFQYALIIKLSEEGLFLDSIRIDNPEGTCNLSELIKVDNNTFICLGHWTCIDNSELWYIKFDKEFNILNDLKLNSNDELLNGFHHVSRNNGNIVFTAHYNPNSHPTYLKVCIYEITVEGVIVREKFYNQSINFNVSSTLLEDSYNYNYKLFSIVPLSERMLCSITYIDTAFNVIDSMLFSAGVIRDQNTARWVNDSVYLLTGRYFNPPPDEHDIAILKMTENDSVITTKVFGKKGDTTDYAGLYTNLDFIDTANIFFAGESNIRWLYQNEPSWIMLNILDSDLNLKDQLFYGGDALYFVNSILATQDSGCVLSCSRYDWRVQNNEFDVYILKVNKDGLLVGTPENPVINTQACYLYPNPGNGILSIKSPYKDLDIQFFDLTGKMIQMSHLEEGNSSIPISDFVTGIYIYRITDQLGQVVQSGKWIKQ